MKLTDKKEILKMSLFFMLLYTISYVTRINYGAVISEIVKAEGMLKSDASLALTTSAITYGIGQLLSGFLGDKINPKKLIFFGLLLTISMNLLLPFCGSAYAMSAAWGVNGIAQAFMWPPLVKIMTSLFTSEDYTKACMYVSWGGVCRSNPRLCACPGLYSCRRMAFDFSCISGMRGSYGNFLDKKMSQYKTNNKK